MDYYSRLWQLVLPYFLEYKPGLEYRQGSDVIVLIKPGLEYKPGPEYKLGVVFTY